MEGKQRHGVFPFIHRNAYIFVCAAIILISFFNLSERHYPLLNSDIAVNILMSADFHLPGDLYFWGQDRAGSMIPLLSWPLVKVAGISPVIAVSLIHFFILVMGFMALASFFRSKMAIVLLCLLWFLPPWHFQDFVVLLFGVQASFVATGLFFLKKFFRCQDTFPQPVWLGAFVVSMTCAVWVSDLAWVSFVTLACLAVLMLVSGRWHEVLIPGLKKILKPGNIFTFLTLLFAGLVFLIYAKMNAVRIADYNSQMINSFHEIVAEAGIAGLSVFKVFIFCSENVVESVFAWLALAGVSFICVLLWKKEMRPGTIEESPLFWFFLLEGLFFLGSMLISHWVYINGTGRRYFSLPFISLSVAILFLVDGSEFHMKRVIMIFLLAAVSVSSLSAVYKFWYPARKPATVDLFSGFGELGKAGIIAEYWNAYRTSGTSPLNIIATPRQQDQVRNPALVDKVFHQPALYLIKDGWFDTFPDTLTQFGRTLYKEGEMFRMGDCWLCRYRAK